MQLLISVRSRVEALQAARNGADLIDLKEPSNGALGALPLATVREIVAALRGEGCAQTVSATVGDPPFVHEDLAARVAALAACGVDLVKVGVERDAAARALLDALAALATPHLGLVPVFIADRGLDPALVAQAAALPFAALMADTADKRGGSLFERVGEASLRGFIACARSARRRVGLAGALRFEHLERLAVLGPDFAGFRGAVCAGEREGALDGARVRELRQRLRAVTSSRSIPRAA
jgi:uncharacterized protein (UPF0264 family)